MAESFLLDEVIIDDVHSLPVPNLNLDGMLESANPALRRKALLAFSYEGVCLGDLAYDTYLRNTGMGTVEDLNEDVLDLLKQSVRYFVGYRELIRKKKIIATVQGHTVYSSFGALARAAVQCGATVYSRKFASGPLTIRRYTAMDDLRNHEFRVMRPEFDQAWKHNRIEFSAKARRYIQERFAGVAINGETGNHEAYGTHKKCYERDELQQILGLDPNKPTACIMSHVFPDAPHSFPSMLYDDYYQWLVETLEIVKDIPGVNWLVKPHPDNKHYNAKHSAELEAQKYTDRYPHIHLLPDTINTASLFGTVDAIVTVSGTAGLEFSALGIPCIQAGQSLYSGLGFTIEPKSVQEYAQVLSDVGKLERLTTEQTERALVAIHLLFTHLRVKCALLPDMPVVFWNKPNFDQVYEAATSALGNYSIETDPLYRNFMLQIDTQAMHLMNTLPSSDVQGESSVEKESYCATQEIAMEKFDEDGSNLIFLISLPRSGSTLLQRILGGHMDVATLAEPWIMLHPLYALKRVGIDSEYDTDLARQALDDFLDNIDGGEEAYIQGIRRFAGDLYARAIARQSRRVFLDKTPRYYRIIPELRRVFPQAKFVILLRNPLAVLASTLHTWFDDDPERLRDTSNHKDLLQGPELLLEGIAELGNDAVVVRYEELVTDPGKVIAGLCARLGLGFDADMLDYGQHPAPSGRLGDQVGIMQHQHATTSFRDKWVGYLAAEGAHACALDYLDQLGDETIAALGYDVSVLRQTLDAARLAVINAAGNEPVHDADRLNAEGESLYAQGDIEAARECFEKARIADPAFTTSYNNLLVLFWESGQTDLALNILADALDHAPNDRDLVINSAQILAALGMMDEANGLCDRYLTENPDDESVRSLLSPQTAQAVQEIPPTNPITTTAAAKLHSGHSHGVITVATSIAPKGIEKQQRAIASWLALGFRAVSLNTADEIAQLQVHFPQVEFITVGRDGTQLAGKPYVFLDDVLGYLRNASSDRICGIVNSDIILRASADLISYIWHEADGALVYGSRVDIQSADDAEGSLYHRGFDFFFFDRNAIGKLPKTNFMLGVPWWDYWVPVGFQLAGVPIKRLDSRIAYHVWHTTNYSTEILLKFGREFVEHCKAAPFLSLYTQCHEGKLGDASQSVLSDAVLDYINRNTAKIAIPGLTSTEPASVERPRVSAIVSTYKSAEFIGECLADLTGQTIADRLEIIVIDAASPENEHSIVAEYQQRFPQIPIRYQRTESRIGVYAAWNMAARMAQGDYLISCSTNDRLRKDACEILARTLDEQPDVALVYGNSLMTQKPHQRFDNAELCSLYLWPEFRYEDLIDRCMVGPHPMWRRSVHVDSGYFNEAYVALGDQDFWLRLGDTVKLKNIPDFTGLYYVSEDSLTGNRDIAQHETDLVHQHYRCRYNYAKWLKMSGTRRPSYAAEEALPTVHVLVLIPPAGLARAADTLDALGVQQYPNLHVSILADQPPPDPALIAETGLNWFCYQSLDQLPALVNEVGGTQPAGWLCLIDAGALLADSALNDAIRYAQRHQEWQLMYVDDDCFDANAVQHSPRFKPDFNLSLLRSQPYIGGCVFIRPLALQAVGGVTTLADWRGSDLALRMADQFSAASVGHIPRVLIHLPEDNSRIWPQIPAALEYRQAVQAHLQRRGLNAVVVDGLAKATLHVRHVVQDRPLVSVIVQGVAKNDLYATLQALLSKTSYANYEVLVLSQGESNLDIASLPGAERIRLLPQSDPLSVMELNAAAKAAHGEYLLWLDGRCQVLQQDWIDIMLSQSAEPDVGIVGVRLIDRRKSILDTGVTLGMGTNCVGSRMNVGLHMSTPGYMSRAQCEQNLSAVNSLCMLVRRATFDAAGGFSVDLTTGLYRDVDFCLKAESAGWRTLWTPMVTLVFLGTNLEADRPPKSKQILDAENFRVLDRWFNRIAQESTFNRNFSHLRQDYQVELNTVPNWDPVVDALPRVLGFGVGSYGSWQYRVVQPLLELDRSESAQCVNAPFPTRNLIVLPTAVDIAHMQPNTLLMHNTLHDHHIEMLEKYKKYNDVFVVFGQDDLMFALPPKNPYSKTVYKDMKKRIRRCADLADCLVVTTEPLAQALREMSADVRVIPNYLSGVLWNDLQSKRLQGSKPRVGWAGAQQHGGDLELIAEVVAATANEVDWIFFGMCPDVLRPYVAEYHQAVCFEDYPVKLASLNLDLAIAPLERNRFNEAKSNLRILEYGVLGWPVIASDIHPYQVGPLCRVPNNAAAWVRAIREHISDLEALAQAGDTLQHWVKTHWMLEDHLDEWLVALQPTGVVRPVSRSVG
ncbi:MAG: sulfotransferase [Gammaproteobacteria bacterium]|nr:sulfotransferase [Gammaproteobacteria bacterium]